MSAIATTLNVRVPWLRLVDLLGIGARTHGLPAKTQCPRCTDGLLRVYEDHACGGQWFSCHNCDRSGDLIELAAWVWDTDIPSAITRLAAEGFDLPVNAAAIERYEREHLDYRQRLRDLHQRSRGALASGDLLVGRTIERVGVRWEGSMTRWLEGPGNLIGAIDKVTVERCFAPRVMKHAEQRRRTNSPSADAVFQGAGWGDVLAVPFYDLPGRVCAFLFVGRDANTADDFVFKPAAWGPRGNGYYQPEAEAGLAMYETVLEDSEAFGRTVVATPYTFTAIQLHVRQTTHSTLRLPLVNWYDADIRAGQRPTGRRARTIHAWQMLADRKLILWAPKLDVATIRQAIQTNARISTVGPREFSFRSLKEYCWKVAPLDLFKRIQRSAKPWPEVVSKALLEMDNERFERTLIELDQAGEDVPAILRRCHYRVRSRKQELDASRTGARTITLRGRTIVEVGTEWRVEPRANCPPEVISNAVLRIDAGVCHPQNKDTYYAGRVLFRRKSLEFCEPAARIDEDPLRWMKDLLLQWSVGFLVCDQKWSKDIVGIAQRFHDAQVAQGVDTVGWDGDQMRFVLPGYAIHLGGETKPVKYPLFAGAVPAQSLEKPSDMIWARLESVPQDRYVGGLFWATAACVIANVIADAKWVEPTGVVLQGRGAIAVGEAVAEALGCVMLQTRNAKTAREALSQEGVHHWPVVYQAGSSLQRRHQRLLLQSMSEPYRNCIVRADWPTSRALMTQGGWHVIDGARPARIDQEARELAGELLPAYLQDLCRRSLSLGDKPGDVPGLPERVLRDLARFVEENDGQADDVLAGLGVLVLDDQETRHEAFADLLGHFARCRKLLVADDADPRGKPTLVREGETLRLGYDDLEKLVRGLLVEPFGPFDVRDLLLDAEVLVEDGDSYWAMPGEWLQKRWRLVERQESGLLKVHG